MTDKKNEIMFSEESLNNTMDRMYKDGIIPHRPKIIKVTQGETGTMKIDFENNKVYVDGEEIRDDD